MLETLNDTGYMMHDTGCKIIGFKIQDTGYKIEKLLSYIINHVSCYLVSLES